MDWLGERQAEIERGLAAKHLEEGSLILYDVTSTYFEGKTCPLRGTQNIGVRVGKVINRYQVAKHFLLLITDNSFSYKRNQHKIETEAQLDGIYVIRTSVQAAALNERETVKAYKSLSQVEQALRCYKTIDLKVRPIYHRLATRVKAHVFLCLLAYYVEWHMRQLLAPLLFEDEAFSEQRGLESVVRPILPSQTAKLKARTLRTAESFPVQSFRTLLTNLSTITHASSPAEISGSCSQFRQAHLSDSLAAESVRFTGRFATFVVM